MHFSFAETRIHDAITQICEEYELTLDDEAIQLDGVVTASFTTTSAQEAVDTVLQSTVYAGWILESWSPGLSLVIHDRSGLDQEFSYEQEDGESIWSLFSAIPELFPLGMLLGVDPKKLRNIGKLSMQNVTLRTALDTVCAKAGLRWKEDRGVVLIGEGGPNPPPFPTPDNKGLG